MKHFLSIICLIAAIDLGLASTEFVTPIQLFALGCLEVPLFVAWFANRQELRQRNESWEDAMRVVEQHDERDVQISLVTRGMAQVPSSQIAMSLDVAKSLRVRIWGPFCESRATTQGDVLLENVGVRDFGRKNPFLIRTNLPHFADRLRRSALWEDLESFTRQTDITVENGKLILEQAGVWQESEAIVHITSILQQFAGSIETEARAHSLLRAS